jgi:hypothetical protein
VAGKPNSFFSSLGPGNELNYATKAMLNDYQQLNLKSDDELRNLTEGFQFANEHLEKKRIQLYYFQCRDKHSIYPEQFPDTVIQHGNESKTDQIVKTLTARTNVPVISPKEKLIELKKGIRYLQCVGDSTHWTQRGAYIGYRMLMKKINENNYDKYPVLQETDYDITVNDMGGLHRRGLANPGSLCAGYYDCGKCGTL